MSDPVQVLVPLLNPNEPGALVSELKVSNGDSVPAGQVLAVLETTKASQVLEAPRGGYIAGLHAQEGETVLAGEVLLWLSQDPDWSPPRRQAEAVKDVSGPLRITEPARALAKEHGLELSGFRSDRLITVKMVQARLGVEIDSSGLMSDQYTDNDLIIYGAGGHGVSVLELVRSSGAGEVVGFLDDEQPPGEMIEGVPVLGGREVLTELAGRGLRQAINAVGGIGDVTSRVSIFELLKSADLNCPFVSHPTAFIEASAGLADGVQVFPHAYVGSRAEIEFGTIVNTSAVVSHDCRLGRVTNISPGAMLAGGVLVGDQVLIGMGVTVNLHVRIGSRARIGNSAVVKDDVPEGAIVKAGSIWPER